MPQTEILRRPNFHSLLPTPTGQTSSGCPIAALCREALRSLSFFLCRNQLTAANTRTAGSPPASWTPPLTQPPSQPNSTPAQLLSTVLTPEQRPGLGPAGSTELLVLPRSRALGSGAPEARSSQTGAARIPKRLRAHEGRTEGRAASRPPLPRLKRDRAAILRAPQRSPTRSGPARPPPSPGLAHRPRSGPTSARPRRRVPTYFPLPGHKQSAQSAAL